MEIPSGELSLESKGVVVFAAVKGNLYFMNRDPDALLLPC